MIHPISSLNLQIFTILIENSFTLIAHDVILLITKKYITNVRRAGVSPKWKWF